MTRGGAALVALVVLAGCARSADRSEPPIAAAVAATTSRAPSDVTPSATGSPGTASAPAGTTTTTGPARTSTSTASTSAASTSTTSTTSTTTTSASTVPAAARTACREVVHIGDSTAEAMWAAPDVGGDPAATMDARYRAVGVESVYPDVSGGRSMVERLDGQSNAIEVAAAVRAGGYSGCWVIMIGTNDAANVAAGGVPGLDTRIAALLDAIGEMPVLWVDTVSRHTDPVWSDTQMQHFNAALARAAVDHPNLRVLDWSSRVRAEWLTADGLHYTTDGRIWRAAITADELARVFPG